MKIIFFLAIFVLCTGTLLATVRTVSNSPATLAQYNNVQAAIDDSAIGDTVYVHASVNAYGGITINKRLSLFGAGWAPQTVPTTKTTLAGLSFGSATASGTQIVGFNFQGVEINCGEADNISFIRNSFIGSYLLFNASYTLRDGYLVESNYFNSGSGFYFHEQLCGCCGLCPGLKNSLITNNVFLTSSSTFYYNANGPMSDNVVINHNLFYGTGSVFNLNLSNFILQNNIFVNLNPTSINSFWEKNITFNCAGTNTPWVGGGNSGAGNIENTDPEMVDQSSVNTNTADPLLDFTIPSGAANDAGTDGKDLGLLFDMTGFLNWTNSRNPKLPVVNQLNINSTANPGGTLDIHLKATQAK